jgi:hypothetical protein
LSCITLTLSLFPSHNFHTFTISHFLLFDLFLKLRYTFEPFGVLQLLSFREECDVDLYTHQIVKILSNDTSLLAEWYGCLPVPHARPLVPGSIPGSDNLSLCHASASPLLLSFSQQQPAAASSSQQQPAAASSSQQQPAAASSS